MMTAKQDIWILEGARTAFARYCGAFVEMSALKLGSCAGKAALERAGVPPEEVDHVIFGNASQTSGDAIYGARHIALGAGIPDSTPAVTVNRICGSGIESVVQASHRILLGEAGVVLAGGAENMSQAPHVIRGARTGLKLGQGKLEDSLMVALLDTWSGCTMSDTSDNLARKYNISREDQDAYALRSQQAAAKAKEAGYLAEEIVPVEIPGRRGATISVTEDDHLRPETTMEKLSSLRPAFQPEGFVTAGNASGIADGAAAVVVAAATSAEAKGWKPMARVVSWGVAGVDPKYMGIGPVPACQMALERANLGLDQIGRIEVNEAFAGQYLAVEKELGLDRDRTNVNGGAISMGHPLAASGTRLIYTVARELQRSGEQYGMASACIGGGQGIAIIIERI